MATLPSPIIRDSFTETWQSVDHTRRTAKKKYMTGKISTFFSNMVFAAFILIVGNGLIHDHLKGSYCRFLESIPYFLSLWGKAKAILLKPTWSIVLQIVVPLLAVYVACFAVCGLLVLLTTALYHPFRKKLPEFTPKENASQLLTMARDARRYSRRSGTSGTLLWSLIFAAIQFAVFALYIVIELKTADALLVIVTDPFMKLIAPYIQSFSELQQLSLRDSVIFPMLMLGSLGLYLIYAFLNLIHTKSVQFMYRYNVPYSFVAEVERYYTFADEANGELTEEEITAKRIQAAEAIRTEALELERIGAYGKAKELLAIAAHSGDSAAMEHYARHWLIAGAKDPARYWLQKCVDTGNAGEYTTKTLRRLKWHLRVRASYLK